MKAIRRVLLGLVFTVLAFVAVACVKTIDGTEISDNTYQEVKKGFTNLNQLTKDGKLVNDGINPIKKGNKITIGKDTFTLKDEYRRTYAIEVSKNKFNYLSDTYNWNKEVYANMVDALMSTDKFGNIIGELAIGKKTFVRNGKTVIQYQLRQNVAWVNNKTGKVYEATINGKKVKQYLKAEDFVTAAEYVINSKNGSPLAPQYKQNILGAKEYIDATKEGGTGDFSKVGVKAIGADIIEYTLLNDINYFDSLLTYSCFLPVNKYFLKEVGTKFGTSADNILVNGPFRVSKHVNEQRIEFVKNNYYWDPGHVYFSKMTWFYVDQSKPISEVREMFEQGKIDSFGVNPTDNEGVRKYIGNGTLQNPENPKATSVRTNDSSTFYGLFNFNRKTYEYPASAPTGYDKYSTKKAVWNKDFRLGFLYGMKVETFLLSRSKNPYEKVYRRFTTPELGIYSEGGKLKDYTTLVDDIYNLKNGTTGVSLSGFDNGSDPIFNTQKAINFFKKAYEELKKDPSVKFPIQIDTIGERDVVAGTYTDKMLDDLEKLGVINGVQLFKINRIIPQSDSQSQDWIFETNNYDLNLSSGWGPDYGDPKTFLNTIVENGDIVANYGFGGTLTDSEKAMQKELLGAYTEKCNEAFAETKDIKKRFQLMAEAEYKAIYEDALLIPIQTRVGYAVVVGKTIPYTVSRAPYGISSSKLKNLMVSKDDLTREERNNLRELFYLQKENKTIKRTNITLSGINGWEVSSTLNGEIGSVVDLPRPYQSLKKQDGSLIDKNDRLEFEGWYLDKELTKPVPKNDKGQYVYPDKDATYYLKSKKYVSPEPEVDGSYVDPKKYIVNELQKVSLKTKSNTGLFAEVYKKVTKDGKTNWVLAETSDAKALINGNELSFALFNFGVYKIVVKEHQYLEGDKTLELICTNKPKGKLTKEIKNVFVQERLEEGLGAEKLFNVEKVSEGKYKAIVELPYNSKKQNFFFFGYKFDTEKPEFDGFEGSIKEKGSGIASSPVAVDGFNILVRQKDGQRVYTIKLIQFELDELTGELKETKTLELEVTVKSK